MKGSGKHMENKNIINVEAVVDYIEDHLDGKLELEIIATVIHYSKYHLHRMFSKTVGITICDYVRRRQLTEAAKLLVFSQKSIIDIAFMCGYESQQAFTSSFKSMYKLSPVKYREKQNYYPLQLRFVLNRKMANTVSKSNIRLANNKDIPAWLELVRLTIDGYPYLDEDDYLSKLENYIHKKQALILQQENITIGIMAFSYDTGSIDFMGIHPQYRKQGIPKLFLDTLMEDYLPNREIITTTYRENDRADTGYRDELKQLGFAEKEFLIEFGYPTQKFILSHKEKKALTNE